MKLLSYPLAVLLLLLSGSSAFAAEVIDTGDTAWIIVATALVMVMTPAGLALFYGGMSRYKNLLNTYAMTFVAYCVGSVVWVMWGYSLAFGPDVSGIVGRSHVQAEYLKSRGLADAVRRYALWRNVGSL